MSTTKIVKMLTGFDIYGHPIEIKYKGDSQYRTLLGSFCTIAVYGLIIFNATSLF